MENYSNYKETETDWLHSIPDHWDWVKAKRLFRSITRKGYTDEPLLSVTQDKGVIPRSDLEDRVVMPLGEVDNFVLVEEGNFVISLRSFEGGIEYSSHRGLVSPAYTVLETGDLVYGPYFKHLFKSCRFVDALHVVSTGIRQGKTINYRDFGELYIPVPPISEQSQVAQFLDEKLSYIDDYVAKKRDLVDLLETQRRAVVNRAVTMGLDDDVAMRDSGVEWLGKIPAHWETRKVKYACHVQRGKFSHRPRNDSRFYDGPYPFIQTGDVARAGKYVRDYEQSLNEKGLAVSRLFKKGTLVMAIAANVGDVAILEFDSCFPDSVVGFRPFDGVSKNYLYYALMAVKSQLERIAVQSAQANLNVERISSMEIALPPHQEQERIASKLDEMDEQIDAAIERTERQIELMQQYRTSLVTEVVTGAVDVRAEVAA